MTTVEKHAPGTPGWFDLMTSEPEAARAFYGKLFGWTYDVSGPEFGHYAMCKVGDRMAAGLGGKPPGVAMPTVWSVYFITDNVDHASNRVTESGGQVTMPPMEIPGQGKMAMFTDASGAAFGMWQPFGHPGAQVRDEHGAMNWCEVNVRDPDQAIAFYRAVFNLEAKQLDAPNVTYYTLHLPGKLDTDSAVAGIMKMDSNWPATVPAHWMPYFAVDSTDASCARATELGGKVCVPAFDTPYGRMAVLEDPQGGTFSINQPPAM